MVSKYFSFQPISFSWVALHPNPKGVLFFIGGAFFGSFPTVFYRYFLRCLFESGYTIVALPFRFTFQHWLVATGLLQEQQRLRPILVEMAKRAGYQTAVYQDTGRYSWIGHSVGCKYVILLELLSSDQRQEDSHWQEDSQNYLKPQQVEPAVSQVAYALPRQVGILDQRSLLIAPDMSDTDSAIPQPLAKIMEALGLGVNPSRQQTQCLIKNSCLFNLTAMISFRQDTIAGSIHDEDETKSDVRWLLDHLSDQMNNETREQKLLQSELPGKHLEPIGIQIGKWIVDLNPLDKFIASIARRKVETVSLHLLNLLDPLSRSKAKGRFQNRGSHSSSAKLR